MSYHNVRFPNESDEYRAARNELLAAEMELRAQSPRLAEQRRNLPPGGLVKEGYEFDEMTGVGETRKVKLSGLFGPGKDSLIIYSYMFGPKMTSPCTSCTSIIDGLSGSAPHVNNRVNLVVVGKSPIERLNEVRVQRGWKNIRLLSSHGNTYNTDYHAENEKGDQSPALNVFVRSADGIRHFYSTELLYAKLGGHPRHVDLIWPVWNLFDLTPEGRGTDWFPKLEY